MCKIYSLQRGTTPTEAPDKWNNQPHIVVFCDEEDDEDLLGQYFIAVEQVLVLESSNIVAAVFHLMAAHYLYNVQYQAKAKELYIFLQEKVLHLPSSSRGKRSPAMLAHIAGISRYEVQDWTLNHCHCHWTIELLIGIDSCFFFVSMCMCLVFVYFLRLSTFLRLSLCVCIICMF